ncbi:hypothetical protein N802_15625 [Knoellia sinensis KCTC 19936]|uniref:Uncharacterized protein n=1 Tax=Knoellia sinensis KCTC 19936 TaxID=1385520 RepID=A0A0A0JAJ3_9MICO|nr:hypothetical protein [Knoellia sinensis]KGN33007.1 hypothetical protein N802_15625 [Knoellia sinensis KCTC 19936]
MSGWWWVVIVLAVLGVLLLVVGFLQMRSARPTAEIKGGFGGPAGSSDVGGTAGFNAPDPRAHWKVGAPLRIAGFAALATAAIIGLALTIAKAF